MKNAPGLGPRQRRQVRAMLGRGFGRRDEGRWEGQGRDELARAVPATALLNDDVTFRVVRAHLLNATRAVPVRLPRQSGATRIRVAVRPNAALQVRRWQHSLTAMTVGTPPVPKTCQVWGRASGVTCKRMLGRLCQWIIWLFREFP